MGNTIKKLICALLILTSCNYSFSKIVISETSEIIITENNRKDKINPNYPNPPPKEFIETICDEDNYITRLTKNMWNSQINDEWRSWLERELELLKIKTDNDTIYLFIPKTSLNSYYIVSIKDGSFLNKQQDHIVLNGFYLDNGILTVDYSKLFSQGGCVIFVAYNLDTEEIKEEIMPLYARDFMGELIVPLNENDYEAVEKIEANMKEQEAENLKAVETYRSTLTPVPESEIETLEIPYMEFESYEKLEKFIEESGFIE